MNTLWNTILDGLTYKDLAGKRQPRTYTVVTGLLLVLLLMASGMAGLSRYALMRSVHTAPVSISLTHPIPETPTTKKPIQPAGSVSSRCPSNATEWTLSPTLISDTYKVIQPACVYQELERTIAWALAVRAGYSRAEATEQLGFSEMPMRQLEMVTIPANADDLIDIPVSFIPPHPNLKEWRLNAQGEAAVTYALRGCFKTSAVVGNRVKIWGGDYAVICLVVEDAENAYSVYSLNEHTYTSTGIPMRSFLLFGYGSDEEWVWLGTQTEPKLEITDAQANANERLTVATLYDSQPWDAKWLMDTYHLSMNPLPADWQTLTNEGDKLFILNALSSPQDRTSP